MEILYECSSKFTFGNLHKIFCHFPIFILTLINFRTASFIPSIYWQFEFEILKKFVTVKIIIFESSKICKITAQRQQKLNRKKFNGHEMKSENHHKKDKH